MDFAFACLLFIAAEEIVRVDVRDGHYVERARVEHKRTS